MLKDQKELLAALNDHGVEYVVIGGHAAIAYGVARLTKDLDVLIRADEKNSQAVYDALAAFGAPMESLDPTDFRDHPNTVVQFGVPPNRIDILQSIAGVTFDEAWKGHVDFEIDDTIVAHYVSMDDLIRNKELVGRPGDLADVDQLRKIRGLK
jgi:Nucleotidyl transferase of unknown function (DUF2204)